MNRRTGKLTAFDLALAEARKAMDEAEAEAFGTVPAAAPEPEPRPIPPLPEEFKQGGIFVLCLFLTLLCLYLIAEWQSPDFWSIKP